MMIDSLALFVVFLDCWSGNKDMLHTFSVSVSVLVVPQNLGHDAYLVTPGRWREEATRA